MFEPKAAKPAADPHPAAVHPSAKDAKGRDLGLLALVGVAVCCGLPVLVGAGALAAVGGVFRNAWIVAAAVIMVLAAAGWRRIRPKARDRR